MFDAVLQTNLFLFAPVSLLLFVLSSKHNLIAPHSQNVKAGHVHGRLSLDTMLQSEVEYSNPLKVVDSSVHNTQEFGIFYIDIVHCSAIPVQFLHFY